MKRKRREQYPDNCTKGACRQPKETAIAAPVVAWLEAMAWEVHQEVGFGGGSNRADIVAVQGPLLWVVETKVRFGMSVLEQAFVWTEHAHFVSVATPFARVGRFIGQAMVNAGIGRIQVEPEYAFAEKYIVRQRVAPRLNRRVASSHLRRLLCDGTRTWAKAGNNCHEYWSPYRQTCANVARVVAEKPGVTIREVFDQTRHHYTRDATARSSMLRWIEAGKVPGVEMRREGRSCRLYPAAKAATS